MATCERTKAALIRRPGYPVGQPAPCFFECCGNEIDAPTAGGFATCPTCGNRFDYRGWITRILPNDLEMCFCVPGEDSIIDMMGPDSRTCINGETLEQVRQRYPGAELRSFDEVCAEKAARQDSPATWTETTAERFEEMLGCVPPALMARGGFLVGEPWDHHATSGLPRFAAFVQVGERYFEASRPMTRPEFRAVELPKGGA